VSEVPIRIVELPPPAPPAPPGSGGGSEPVSGGNRVPEFSPDIEPFELIPADDIKPGMDSGDFVEGLLIEGGASVVYGQSNVGKSFWALDLAVHVAAGRAWRSEEVNIDGGAVIYVALEGTQGFDNRIEAMRRRDILGTGTPLYCVKTNVNLLVVTDPARLVETVKEAATLSGQKVKLVIIDTLSRAIAGGNENSSEDMTAAVAAVDRIRKESGAHVLLVHHCGKDEARGSRGHSSLRAAVDTEIELFRPEGESVTTAHVTKQRDLEGGQLFPFSLDVVKLGINRWGKPVTSCVVIHESVDKAVRRSKPGRNPTATDAQFLALLPVDSTGLWLDQAKEDLGVSRSTFFRVKGRLEREGKAKKASSGGWIRSESPIIPE